MNNRVDTARNKLIIRFVVILVAVFSLYGMLVTYSVYRNLLNNNHKNVENSIEITSENLSQTFDMMRSTTYALSGSESVVKWRSDETLFTGNNKQTYLNQQQLNEEMQQVLTYNNTWNFDLFDYITIYENDVLLAITYTKPYSTQRIIDKTTNIQKRLELEEEYANMIPPRERDSSIYTTLRVQADFSSNNSLYIIGSTSAASINDKLVNLETYQGSLVYIIDKKGTVFSSSNGERLGETLDQSIIKLKGKNDLKIDGVTYEVIKKKINSDFYLVYMLPKVAIMKQTLVDMKMFLLFSVVIATLLIVFAILTVVNRTKYESQILMDEMQLKYLQQQMNPHFLFNILLTIQIKAKMSGDEAVYKMIGSLSALLRAGLNGDKRTTIPIREEMKYVEYYLSLQQERYDERLTYNINVSEETLLDCEIPRLVVEPMVENAIVHGVENMAEPALVNVDLVSDGKDIFITVKDNGEGFDVSTLDKPTNDSLDGVIKREHTGINSTNKRIKLLYGENYGISINSTVGCGTTILIKIPKKEFKG